MKKSKLILSLLCLSRMLFGQDTITYAELSHCHGSIIRVKDAYNKPYKLIKPDKTSTTKTSSYIYSNEKRLKLDTSIFIDFTTTTPKDSNSIKIFHFVTNQLSAPKHSGDPNIAILSLIFDHKGKLIEYFVLENVKNICEGNWETSFKAVNISPISTKHYTEYIVKLDEICYCECLIDPDIKSGP